MTTETVLSTVRGLSWPLVIAILAVLFRPSLADALDRLRVLRSPYFEGRFDPTDRRRRRRRRG